MNDYLGKNDCPFCEGTGEASCPCCDGECNCEDCDGTGYDSLQFDTRKYAKAEYQFNYESSKLRAESGEVVGWLTADLMIDGQRCGRERFNGDKLLIEDFRIDDGDE